jgi:hypothetical protein
VCKIVRIRVRVIFKERAEGLSERKKGREREGELKRDIFSPFFILFQKVFVRGQTKPKPD